VNYNERSDDAPYQWGEDPIKREGSGFNGAGGTLDPGGGISLADPRGTKGQRSHCPTGCKIDPRKAVGRDELQPQRRYGIDEGTEVFDGEKVGRGGSPKWGGQAAYGQSLSKMDTGSNECVN